MPSSTAANENDWDLVLPSIMLAYRTSVHRTTKHTPFQLMFEREAKLPKDVIFEAPTPNPLCTSQYILKLKTDLLQSYHLVRKFSGCETRYQKQLYDRNIKYQEYQMNDLVWLLRPAIPRGRHRKFHRPWDGLYVIKKKLSDAVYRKREGSRKRIVVHFNRLKPFFPIRMMQTLTKELISRTIVNVIPRVYLK